MNTIQLGQSSISSQFVKHVFNFEMTINVNFSKLSNKRRNSFSVQILSLIRFENLRRHVYMTNHSYFHPVALYLMAVEGQVLVPSGTYDLEAG